MDKKALRLRRSLQTRQRIRSQGVSRLLVYRSNKHIYASVVAVDARVVLTVSSTQKEVMNTVADVKTSSVGAAVLIGKLVAQRALEVGITEVAFDRSGYRYHGKVRALAEAAREGGLIF